MKMFHNVILLVGFAMPIFAIYPPQEVLQRFNEKKALKDCLGDQPVDAWTQEVSSAVKQCKSGFVPVTQSPLPPIIITTQRPQFGFPTTRRDFIRTNSIAPLVPKNPVIFAVVDELPTPSTISTRNRFNIRQKRQADFTITAADLLAAEDDIKAKISNFTCVLNALKFIDANGQLRFSSMAQDIDNMPIHSALKADMQEVLQECASFISCQPQGKRSIVPEEVKKIVAFLKCAKLKRQVACMKHDIRQYLIDGLPPNVKPTFNLEQTVQRVFDAKVGIELSQNHAIALLN